MTFPGRVLNQVQYIMYVWFVVVVSDYVNYI